MHPIFVIHNLVSGNTCSISPATITLLTIGLTITPQFTLTKTNAITTMALDSLLLINDRIVSVCVEWEEESILILFVIASSRVPGDTSEAPTASPCLLDLHQRHGCPAVVDSAVDTLVGPFFAISAPVKQLEGYHRFLHSTGNNVKDKFSIVIWSYLWPHNILKFSVKDVVLFIDLRYLIF
jgi:hypothetical protein